MVLDKIKAILVEYLSVDESEITIETSFIEDLGADSLDLFQIISELKERFDIEFDNNVAEKIKTVGDAVNYVKEAMK